MMNFSTSSHLNMMQISRYLAKSKDILTALMRVEGRVRVIETKKQDFSYH